MVLTGDSLEEHLNASANSSVLTHVEYSSETKLSWEEIHETSAKASAWLNNHRTSSSSVLILSGKTSVAQVVAIRAAWMGGMPVMMLPPPRRRNLVKWNEELNELAKKFDSVICLFDDRIVPQVLDNRAASIHKWYAMLLAERSRSESANVSHNDGADSPVLFQPTSGTTGHAKVAQVSQRNLLANYRAIREGMNFSADDDHVVSWLPLFHDMGLIGMLGVPMLAGADLTLFDPQEFARDPKLWMRQCAAKRATVTGGPSSVIGLASRLMSDGLDLSAMRLVMNGSEEIDVGGFRAFLDAGCGHRLNSDTAFSVYGLAEATLAVTFPTPGSGLNWDVVQGDSLATQSSNNIEGALRASEFARLGSPLSSVEVRIQTGGSGAIGEIEIRGPSVTAGYLGEPPFAEDAWFPTGDLGYWSEGELVVCGRLKDVITVAGRNVFPEEIERVVARNACVWRGNCAVLGVTIQRRQRIIAVVECDGDLSPSERTTIVQAVHDLCEIELYDVRTVPVRGIPKTTSGKVSRSRCKALLNLG